MGNRNRFLLGTFALFLGGWNPGARSEDFSRTLERLQNLDQPLACLPQPSSSPAPGCDLVWDLTRKPGVFDDGTGSIVPEEIYKKQTEHLDGKPLFTEALWKLLTDSSSTADTARELAMRATGEDQSKDCSANFKRKSKGCYERVASKIVEQAYSARGPEGLADFDAYIKFLGQPQVVKASQDVERALIKSADPDHLKKVQQVIFPKIVDLIIDKVKRTVQDRRVRRSLVRKLKRISFDFRCSFDSTRAEYDPDRHQVKLCPAILLRTKSEFTVAAMLAHEISHSIDPCQISVGTDFKYREGKKLEDLEAQNPFGNVLACLRAKESVGARHAIIYDPKDPLKDRDGVPLPTTFARVIRLSRRSVIG